jgi:hypothetical protein
MGSPRSRGGSSASSILQVLANGGSLGTGVPKRFRIGCRASVVGFIPFPVDPYAGCRRSSAAAPSVDEGMKGAFSVAPASRAGEKARKLLAKVWLAR